MEFIPEDFKSNIYETSKSKKDENALLDKKYQDIEVYDFDCIKEWFCDTFRGKGKDLKSCDAYYQHLEHKEYLLMEFKNTHHKKLKSFMDEIGQKFVDSHMLLAETFWKNRKVNDMGKKLKLCLVYNDSLSYGNGVVNFSHNLNHVKPLKGSKQRASKDVPVYEDEEEFLRDIRQLQELYQTFYAEILVQDKKEFCSDYIESEYFR